MMIIYYYDDDDLGVLGVVSIGLLAGLVLVARGERNNVSIIHSRYKTKQQKLN